MKNVMKILVAATSLAVCSLPAHANDPGLDRAIRELEARLYILDREAIETDIQNRDYFRFQDDELRFMLDEQNAGRE
ncbi:MAG TPA: hypothetical protein VGP28_04530 [Methylocella sp.]|jgi:hypothetical protein|nr:hypothetical protein [Methylocella sp.]